MRRLPIFFVVDVSESMLGDNLRRMEQGLAQIISTLRRDPHALETVYLSVIGFAGITRTLAPLMELASFYPPRLPVGSGTSLGAALNLLMDEIDRHVQKTTPEKKGDWKPVVYLLTDGKPTDSVEPAIQRWRKDYAHKAHLIAIAIGIYADLALLKRLTDQALVLDGSREENFARFVQWMTASVSTQSQRMSDAPGDAVSLAKLDENAMQLAKDLPFEDIAGGDPDCVLIAGRCQSKRKDYLMKYERVNRPMQNLVFKLETSHYAVDGCYPVDSTYHEWSDPRASRLVINTDLLEGTLGCPYCGNPCALAKCGCGGVFCVSGPGMVVCPWCESRVEMCASDASEGFDVARGRG